MKFPTDPRQDTYRVDRTFAIGSHSRPRIDVAVT